jgi:hypothetical protein
MSSSSEKDPRAWHNRFRFRIGTWVLGFVLSNLLTAVIAFILGAFGGAYLEILFTNAQGARFGILDATLDFTHPRTFRAYYGNYNNGTKKTEIIDALFTLREGSRTGKFTGKKIREFDNHTYTLSGFTNGVDIVLTQRGDSDAHGEAILLLKIGEDRDDKHAVFYGYEVTEDTDPATSQITVKKCPLLMIEEETFQAMYKTADRVRSRYHFLDANCEDFAIPGPFVRPK